MNIPTVPPSICADSSHSEMVIIGLLLLVGLFARMWWKARLENVSDESQWKARMETKLDEALAKHQECQRQLPEKYLLRSDFKDFLERRSREWQEFREDFKSFMEEFKHHKHNANGKLEQ